MANGERRYSAQEMREILSRIQRAEPDPAQGEGMTRAELIETAREVGFAEEQVTTALARYEEERQLGREQEELRHLSRRGLSTHLLTFLWVNALLLAINLWVGPPFWFFIPLAFWGLGLFFHLRRALYPDPDRLLERARRRQAKRRLKQSRKEFRDALTQGAANLLSATARKIDHEVGRLGKPRKGPSQ